MVDNYTVTPEDRRIRPDFDVKAQFRVEFDTDETSVKCVLFLDSLQANWFEAFERDLLRQGSRWFLFDLWIGGQMVEHRARFKERPEASARIGEEWSEYSFTLELIKRKGLRSLINVIEENGLPQWPELLPAPLVDSYSIKPEERRAQSEFDVGTLSRLVFDTDETLATCILLLEPEQANIFESFERDVLKQGSRWFNMPLWVGGQMFKQRVRFASRPEASKEGQIYSTYSFQLDIAHREGLMDKATVEILLENDPYEMMLYMDRLQVIVNERYPKSLPYPVRLN